MPVRTDVFGVYKIFRMSNPITGTVVSYVIDDVEEEVIQNTNKKQYMIGTINPRIIDIQGAESRLTITAPLLVVNGSFRTSINMINDGLRLFDDLTSSISSTLNYDPGFLIESMNFKASPEQGATYTIKLRGDYDALRSEGWTGNGAIGIETPSSNHPLGNNNVYRQATYYDLIATLGGFRIYPDVDTAYLQDLDISMNYNIEDWAAIGQEDQRKFFGITGLDVKVNGTIISTTRSPLSGDFPLQASVDGTTQGGRAWPTDGTFNVTMRNGITVSILGSIFANQKFVFDSSSLKANTGKLATRFSGMAWYQTN